MRNSAQQGSDATRKHSSESASLPIRPAELFAAMASLAVWLMVDERTLTRPANFDGSRIRWCRFGFEAYLGVHGDHGHRAERSAHAHGELSERRSRPSPRHCSMCWCRWWPGSLPQAPGHSAASLLELEEDCRVPQASKSGVGSRNATAASTPDVWSDLSFGLGDGLVWEAEVAMTPGVARIVL